MTTSSVLVNDTVRIKVKFIDINASTGEQILVSPVSVLVTITKFDGTLLTSTVPTALTSSEYYYDFTPTVADTYKIRFVGSMSNGTQITVNQQLYVSTSSDEYKPTITLKAEEIMTFAPDVTPLYLSPEEILPLFPEASLIEIGELIHFHSLEVESIYGIKSTYQAEKLAYAAIEYIKAAVACDLSRMYNYGGDDDVSVTLADLTVTARNFPRTLTSRGNAVTWCQIAAALRQEMLAMKTGPRGIQPKGLPSSEISNPGRFTDPDTYRDVWLTDRDLYGASRRSALKTDPMPDRGIRGYD
jgi:hypothetical protein